MPIIILVGAVILGYIVRKIIFTRLIRWARQGKRQIYDIIIESMSAPFITWFLILGLYFVLELANLPENLVNITEKLLLVLAIFSVTFVLANIAGKMVRAYASRLETTLPVTSLTQNIARIIIFAVGILIILNSLGLSITPILATLGVGGLAVALALQDTLSNLFAGFYIIAARQIRIGHYIKLASGEEGYVSDITWRATTITALPNHEILIPNAKLAEAIVVNYNLPDKEVAVLVNLGVHYKSDLEKVEKITSEVAKEIMKEITGGVSGFEPFIRYGEFGDFSVRFTVILRAREFVDQYLIKHEFIKRLHKRYLKEGIVVPYPIRAINNEQEK